MYNTWKQMVQFSDEHNVSIEEVPIHLNTLISIKQLKLPVNHAKKIESMSIPKQLCQYKT